MKLRLLTAASMALAGTSAHAMDVATFLDKANALQRKGAMAIFSGEIKVVMGEINAATKALRAERLADVAANRHPKYCPKGGKGGLDQKELFAAMNSVPDHLRPRTQVKDALRTAFAKKYPCPR
jgi:hypothetical protein